MTLDEAIDAAIKFWWTTSEKRKDPPIWVSMLVEHLSEKRQGEAFNFELCSWLPQEVQNLLENKDGA